MIQSKEKKVKFCSIPTVLDTFLSSIKPYVFILRINLTKASLIEEF